MCPVRCHGAAKLLVRNSRLVKLYTSHCKAGRPPDAVNLWIGSSASITSIHNGMVSLFFVGARIDTWGRSIRKHLYCSSGS